MRAIIKRFSVSILMILFIFSTCLTSYAADNSGVGKLGQVLDEISTYQSSNDSGKKAAYNKAVETWNSLASSSGGEAEATFAGETKTFTNISTDGADSSADINYVNAYISMNACLTSIKSTSTDVKTVEGATSELNTVVNTMNSKAAVSQASQGLSSVMPLVNQFTGMIVVLMLLGMAIFTSLDVAYLVFPVAKQQMDAAGSSGRASVSKTNKATGEAKFRWISDDAIGAYQQATEIGKNPLFTYLKMRLISYIAVAIVIYILMSGNLAVIINFVLQMLESVFDMLGSLTIK